MRIFNIFSTRMYPNDGRVGSNFTIKALQDIGITIYGYGQQTHSFYHVEDLIDAMVKMMNLKESFTGPFNIGNLGEVTILCLAESALRLSASKSKLIYWPLPSDDPK